MLFLVPLVALGAVCLVCVAAGQCLKPKTALNLVPRPFRPVTRMMASENGRASGEFYYDTAARLWVERPPEKRTKRIQTWMLHPNNGRPEIRCFICGHDSTQWHDCARCYRPMCESCYHSPAHGGYHLSQCRGAMTWGKGPRDAIRTLMLDENQGRRGPRVDQDLPAATSALFSIPGEAPSCLYCNFRVDEDDVYYQCTECGGFFCAGCEEKQWETHAQYCTKGYTAKLRAGGAGLKTM